MVRYCKLVLERVWFLPHEIYEDEICFIYFEEISMYSNIWFTRMIPVTSETLRIDVPSNGMSLQSLKEAVAHKINSSPTEINLSLNKNDFLQGPSDHFRTMGLQTHGDHSTGIYTTLVVQYILAIHTVCLVNIANYPSVFIIHV